MFRNDYILRLVEEFVQAILRAKRLRQENRLDEAYGALNEVCQALTGLPLGQVAELSLGDIKNLVSDSSHEAVLAALLAEGGEIDLERNYDTSAKAFFKRAFMIYDDLDRRQLLTDDHGHHQRFLKLLERL